MVLSGVLGGLVVVYVLGEDVLADVDRMIERLERARSAALEVGNPELYREASLWIAPSMRVKVKLEGLLRLLREGRSIAASSEACALADYVRKLRLVMRTSGSLFITASLVETLAKVYAFSERICRLEGSEA